MNTFIIVFATVVLTVLAQKFIKLLDEMTVNIILNTLSDLCKEAIGCDCFTVKVTKNNKTFFITHFVDTNKCIKFSFDIINDFHGTTKEEKIQIIKSLPLKDTWI